MIGIGDREYLALRFEGFAREVLGRAAEPLRAPLEVSALQMEAPVSFDQYQPESWRECRWSSPGGAVGPVHGRAKDSLTSVPAGMVLTGF